MPSPIQEKTDLRNELESYLSPLTILLFLAMLILLGMVVGSGVTFLLGKYFGASITEIIDNLEVNNSIENRNFIRFSLLTNHLFLFIIPPLILSFIFLKNKWYKFVLLKKLPLQQLIINGLVGAFLIIISMPLVQYIYYWNKQIPLPDWARKIDDDSSEMIKNLLVTEVSWELFFNIFIIAVIPAIGEEMVFRGVLQRQFEKWFSNPHIAIWCAAAIFSLIHMQLEGFFPRLFLGAILGYLFYWSKSLWIPIFVHFINNAIQIIAVYSFEKDISTFDIDKIDQVPIWSALLSVILILTLSKLLIRFNDSVKFEDKNLHF